RNRREPMNWFRNVMPEEVKKAIARVRREGALSIRDIDDDVLVDKDHPWASRKPSKRALHLAFFHGRLAVRAPAGMVKTYELMERHFGWDRSPKPASERATAAYFVERALRSQGVVSLDSASYLETRRKPGLRQQIAAQTKRGDLVPLAIGDRKTPYW